MFQTFFRIFVNFFKYRLALIHFLVGKSVQYIPCELLLNSCAFIYYSFRFIQKNNSNVLFIILALSFLYESLFFEHSKRSGNVRFGGFAYLNDFGGEGITKETVTPDTDYEALYKRLCDNKQYLVEETIKQNEQMDRLSPSSINTIRMVTLLHEGKVHFMYALVRMSNGTNCVDNICSGGMYVSIGADGVIHKNAYCDATGVYYEEHPFTHTRFNGFEIPMFFEAVEMCKKAALVVPQVGYIGWDVAITPTRPVLVEGNTLPSYDMCQNYGHIDNKTGVKPRFVEILGEEYFK